MREDRLRDQVTAGLDAARTARAQQDPPARHAALLDAWRAAVELGDLPLLQTACWRLAKARYDLGGDADLVEPLVPLLGAHTERGAWLMRQKVGPFDHYAPGLRALSPLSRRTWDRRGYDQPVLDALWTAWIDAHQRAGDPFQVAWGRIQLAWRWACTGRVDTVYGEVVRYARLAPGELADAPTRHPRAAHPDASVAWVQLDLARTLLRAATWSGRERLAWEASELLEDAAEDAELARGQDLWFLDAQLRAAERFGWDGVVERYAAPYALHAGTAPGGHAHRVRAWCARHAGDPDAATAHAVRAAESLAEAHGGPEWVVESWIEAALTAGPPSADAYRARGHAEADRTAVAMDRIVRR